ncbi:hypothetical protein POTOM_023991 [Populus tomentosa]|uniref:Uncharacterized protein n=1 Tax=Populus tomentosa TaxID=118781 RepID=A0A8X7ZR78_POPTO|nr:hypothetical protein POTOM_023991 [Populus tomentosa]
MSTSLLRFNYRGFDWLDKKNTIFGKITGDSIFNLLSLGEAETNKNDDWPLDPPPRITSVENPFEDIIPKVPSKSSIEPETETENKDSKKKAEKLCLMQKAELAFFWREAEEEENQLAATKQKTKSSHDVLNDPHLLKEENPRMRQLIIKKGKELGDLPPKLKQNVVNMNYIGCAGSSSLKDHQISARILKPRLNHKLNYNFVPARSNAESIDDDQTKTYSCSVKLNEEDYCRNRRSADFKDVLGNFEGWESGGKTHESGVMSKLEKLRKALSTKADASNSESGVADNEDLSDWGTIWLTFAPERGKDGMSRKEDSNDYVVHDPLLEKGKEKFNQMRAKQKRREREWAGKPLA